MEQITDIHETQEILYGCLSHFKRICEENGLRYYLSNGTLLGAIKYGDFIPWDDDVDVLMPREDYDRFLKLEGIETDRYALLTHGDGSGWQYAYSKLSDKTTVVSEANADFGTEVGLSLDIFPLDYRTDHKSTSLLNAYYCGLQKRFLCASVQKQFYSPRTGIKRFILKMIYRYSHAVGADRLRGRLLKIAEKSGNGGAKKYCGPVVWTCYNKGECIRTQVFEKTETRVFHGGDFSVPAGYDEYLRGLYGYYVPDPPIEKQKSNHAITIYRKNADFAE